MLYPDAYGELPRFHRHTAAAQRGESIARGVTGRNYERVRVLLIRLVFIYIVQRCGYSAAGACKAFQPRGETNLAAAGQNICAHAAHHAFQSVAAYMRFAEIRHLFGRAEPCERRKYVGVITAVGLRIQLAVRERTRAAFAELHIVVRVEPAARKKARYRR